MKKEVASLRKEYESFKGNKGKMLNMLELKRTIKFRVKLKKTINEVEELIIALNKVQEYGQTISTSRAKLKKELKNLLVMKETI